MGCSFLTISVIQSGLKCTCCIAPPCVVSVCSVEMREFSVLYCLCEIYSAVHMSQGTTLSLPVIPASAMQHSIRHVPEPGFVASHSGQRAWGWGAHVLLRNTRRRLESKLRFCTTKRDSMGKYQFIKHAQSQPCTCSHEKTNHENAESVTMFPLNKTNYIIQ